MTAEHTPPTAAALSDRYEDDPLLRAFVEAFFTGGFTDEDGVGHPGPTIGNVRRAAQLLDWVLAALAFPESPSAAPTTDELLASVLRKAIAVDDQAVTWMRLPDAEKVGDDIFLDAGWFSITPDEAEALRAAVAPKGAHQ